MISNIKEELASCEDISSRRRHEAGERDPDVCGMKRASSFVRVRERIVHVSSRSAQNTDLSERGPFRFWEGQYLLPFFSFFEQM